MQEFYANPWSLTSSTNDESPVLTIVHCFIINTASGGTTSNIENLWVMIIRVLAGERRAARCSATVLSASTSSPLSISSKMIYLGFRSIIWRISNFLLSPQLNPTFKSLQRNSLESCNSSNNGSIRVLNPRNVVGTSSVTS